MFLLTHVEKFLTLNLYHQISLPHSFLFLNYLLEGRFTYLVAWHTFHEPLSLSRTFICFGMKISGMMHLVL